MNCTYVQLPLKYIFLNTQFLLSYFKIIFGKLAKKQPSHRFLVRTTGLQKPTWQSCSLIHICAFTHTHTHTHTHTPLSWLSVCLSGSGHDPGVLGWRPPPGGLLAQWEACFSLSLCSFPLLMRARALSLSLHSLQ